MQIKNKEQIEEYRELIGDQNAKACGRALADGAQVWFFQTAEEIETDPDLRESEKAGCQRILSEEGLGYAGWVRPPKRRPIPSFEPAPGYDTHGNSRGGGSGSRNESIH